MRKRIYEIVEISKGKDALSTFYDVFMMLVIIVSIVPLGFRNVSYRAFRISDKVCVTIFIIDYLLRWMTADYKYKKRSVLSFLRYPFSFMAIIDLVSILPSISVISHSFKLLKIIRLIRAMRVLRAFKFFRYSQPMRVIGDVIKSSARPLMTVFGLAVGSAR